MKSSQHIDEAERIGADSWELLNYAQLPKNASKKRQVEALKLDQQWLENHHNEIVCRIDILIAELEEI